MNVAWWAIVVSACSLIVAGISLGWNVVSFRRSGPLISVTLTINPTQEVRSEREGFKDWQVIMLSNDRFSCTKVNAAVSVINSGRAAVDITDILIKVDPLKGAPVSISSSARLKSNDQQETERRLEAGSTKVFNFDISEWWTVDRFIGRHSPDRSWVELLDISTTVTLGNGVAIKAKKIPYRSFTKFVEDLEVFKRGIEQRGVVKPDENKQ
ncbi:hypothetical protein [Amycolatopsis sp. TNS106]|uniref:hypothetical protein n=1 Tax=Amycolatopsis sp. TNS106 TaxID=2861750 RepID=UPI001C5776EC|nr:hypothetical protein [Amycolatopsis sp. TNS106]